MKQKLNFGWLAALFDLHAGEQPVLWCQLPYRGVRMKNGIWQQQPCRPMINQWRVGREGSGAGIVCWPRCHRPFTYWAFAYLIKSIILMRLRYKMLNDIESICVALLAVACGVCVMSTIYNNKPLDKRVSASPTEHTSKSLTKNE